MLLNGIFSLLLVLSAESTEEEPNYEEVLLSQGIRISSPWIDIDYDKISEAVDIIIDQLETVNPRKYKREKVIAKLNKIKPLIIFSPIPFEGKDENLYYGMVHHSAIFGGSTINKCLTYTALTHLILHFTLKAVENIKDPNHKLPNFWRHFPLEPKTDRETVEFKAEQAILVAQCLDEI